jgi:hypothetical protein
VVVVAAGSLAGSGDARLAVTVSHACQRCLACVQCACILVAQVQVIAVLGGKLLTVQLYRLWHGIA